MSSRKHLFLFAVFFVIYELTVYLSNDMIMPAMPKVVHEFNAPLSNVALSLTFYIIGGSLLQLILGPLSDIVGKRKVMLFGNVLFLIATAIIPLSSSINQFLAARLFQGMGLCFIFIGYAMVHELFNDVEAVKLTTLLSNIGIFAPLVGPVIGSGIVHASHWQFIFIISAVLGLISLFGLIKYMPQGKIVREKPQILDIMISYKNIFMNKNFMLGMLITSISVVPIIAWIGLSPVIIIETMHKPFSVYIGYQSVIFGGFVLSSTLIQKIAGKFSFYQLISFGSKLLIIGLVIACIFNSVGVIFIIGMFIYSFGFGIYNGSIVRISLMATGESTSLSSAVMSLINCLFLSVGLEGCNRLSDYFGYSLTSFSIINLIVGIVAFILTVRFANDNKDRIWEENITTDIQLH